MRVRSHRKKLMLILGADRLLGRHLVRASEVDGWELVAPPPTMLDLCDREATIDAVCGWKPNAVVNLPPRGDQRRLIVDGTRNIAVAVAKSGTRFVHVSTDAVFRGRSVPYDDGDRPDPITDEGAWRARAELEVLRTYPDATVVRTSMLYGTDDLSDFQRLVQRVCTGEAEEAFCTDEVRCPTHAGDLAAAISRIAHWRRHAGVLNVAAPEYLSVAEFAELNAVWLGHEPRIITRTTIAAKGDARAGMVVLDSRVAGRLGVRCRVVAEWLDDPA